MKTLLQRLFKFIAYGAAGVVILLAIAVGLFRLFLPRLPEYQEDIKDWASATIGMNVEFSGMDARWGLSGPEVEFYDAELISLETNLRIVAAEKVSVGVGVTRLLLDGKPVIDRVVVQDTSIEVRQLEDGNWWVQGRPPDELLPTPKGETGTASKLEIIGEDIKLKFLQPGDESPRKFRVPRLTVSRDAVRLAIDATIDLPEDLGRRLSLAATQMREGADPSGWDVAVEIEDIDLVGVSALHTAERAQFGSGSGDIDVSLAYADGLVQRAVVDIDIDEIAIAQEPPFSINGLFEYRNDDDGWLVASHRFQLRTNEGTWPDSSIRIETSTDDANRIVMLNLEASYLKLEDFRILLPWMTAEQHDLAVTYDPDGVVRDLNLAVADVDTKAPRFDVSAEFDEIGIAAVGDRPGIRGFSGVLRADSSGGRLEADAPGMAITAPKFLGDVVYLDEASGTLIWRRSNNRTTLLSDSIVVRNADFDMETNVEIKLADDGHAPIVDLAASWSINDLATAKRYIPYIPRIPKTSAWFQDGIIAGRIPRGTARLYGPMDKFPFDGGEGRFVVEANIRDARIRYLRRWPVADISDLDIAVENMRLYSNRNHVVTAGNTVSNAEFELSDFRLPILTLSTYSTGTLESVRQLIAQSPLGVDVFGGKLEQLTVSGDGSFSLDLTVPVREQEELEFTSRMQTSNGSLQFEGFPAPVTDLSGVITVRKDDVSSESLGGLFLGRPVSIELHSAPQSMPDYRVIAIASGTATASSLIDELGVPLTGKMSGETAFDARLLFPRGRLETPSPFAVEIDSDLRGLATDLPRPLGKSTEEAIAVTTRIELPADGEHIESRGSAENLMTWDIEFGKEQDAWDFDRGLVWFGPPGDEEEVETPGTRGLHLRGSTDFVYLQEWFDLSDEDDAQNGMAERIRSIDMTIGNLHILGQHLVGHRVRVDRSALDWLVQLDGEDVVGSAFVPYDFRSGRELVVEMDRLRMPGDETGVAESRTDVDPRSLPPISVKADELAFGDRYLGAVEANFRHTVDGLESDRIVSKDATFDIVGAARWVVDESDPLGSRSYVTASLSSQNVQQTMKRLDFEPGIVSDDLSMLLDFDWSGGPRQDFMESLDGEVKVRIGSGQLDMVDPGAGRMFGLMSVAALPRRLALDFRDVFGKGFGFDKISGDFRVVDGETYTCNLSLEGPAANIGIVGRSGLVSRDYDQVAMVSANFGSTLPVVGGVLGGPQVAAVMLIFSQIFKKPLQEVSQIYYGVSGSWDDPVIETTQPKRFAENAEKSGCIESAATDE